MTPTLDEVINALIALAPEEKAVVKRTEAGIYEVNIKRRVPRKEIPNSLSHQLEYSYVEISVADKDPKYGILHLPRSVLNLRHFPGYGKQFILETKTKPFVMHLTAAEAGTKEGEHEGGYICHPRLTKVNPRFLERVPDAATKDGSFLRFYEQTGVIGGQWIRIYKIGSELYRAEIL